MSNQFDRRLIGYPCPTCHKLVRFYIWAVGRHLDHLVFSSAIEIVQLGELKRLPEEERNASCTCDIPMAVLQEMEFVLLWQNEPAKDEDDAELNYQQIEDHTEQVNKLAWQITTPLHIKPRAKRKNP